MAAQPSQPKRDNALLAHALVYAARGWRVFPLQPNTKIPFRGTRGFYDATTDEGAIRAWWARWPSANIGIATGDGLVVIDEDTYKGADASEWLLPITLQAHTARGGQHRYFAYEGPLPTVAEGKLAPGICIKATGGYVVAAPSRFQGKPYAWVDWHQPVSVLPERIARMMRGESARPQDQTRQPARNQDQDNTGQYWVDKAVDRARQIGRNNAGLWLAQQLIWNDCADPEVALIYYSHVVEDWESPAYTEREAVATLRQAQRHGKREPARSQTAPRPIRPAVAKPAENIREPITEGTSALQPPPPPAPSVARHRTDMGNALRLVARHGAELRYVAAWGQWLVWDGTRWRKDQTDEVVRRAKDTVASIYAEAADCEDEAERKELAKWAMRSEADARVRAMLSLAESEPEQALASEQLDAAPWLLNVRNGTLDLRTGALRPHSQADLCTKRAEVDYDPKATCPTWQAFLRRVFAEDGALIGYLQRAIGYALTCDISEQCVFVLYGNGANGKSTMLDTLVKLLGDYAMTTPADTLMVKHNQTIPSDVARLNGARFVAASESGDGRRLDEELVKRISGGDRMAARFMHHDWFEFYPVLKLFLAVNHRPAIRGTDNGIWRRIQLWPFEVTIPAAEQDRKLTRKLLAEAPGILAWAIQGCLAWQRDGLNPPARVTQATQEYRSDMDAIGRFITERCVSGPRMTVTTKRLYEAYKAWCDENGEHEGTQTRFGTSLRERGYQREHTMGGQQWTGLGLIEHEGSE